jgi:radical SAM-linked protein
LSDDPQTLPRLPYGDASSVRGKGELPGARLRLQYEKRHPASCLSHLETLTLFHRALRRSKLPIHYTGGEHPHPKMAFSPALPVGVESLAEYLDLWLSRMPEAGEVEKRLNEVLPEGISVQHARPVPLNASSLEQSIAWMEYDISFPEATPETPSREDLERAMEAFYDDNTSSAGPDSKEDRKSGELRRAVKLEGKEDGHGLVCRIHRLSGSTASAMRVLQVLFPTSYRNGLQPRIVKTDAALLPPSPPAVASKRKLRHDK